MLNSHHEIRGQLEIPEAEPIQDTAEEEILTPLQVENQTTDLVTYDDIGYSIRYPKDWEEIPPNVIYGLSAFVAPEGGGITVKSVPADDRTLEDFADEAKDPDYMQSSKFYMNSSTTLGGLPAFIVSGIKTYNPSAFELLQGEQGYTVRGYDIWGYSADSDTFYGILFAAPSKTEFDANLPIVKNIIDSFTIDETASSAPDVGEDDNGDNVEDTFVGSAGDDEDNDNEDESN
jgi:hypothetical protein